MSCEELIPHINDGELVSLYTDPEEERFTVGFVLAVTEESVLLKLVDPYGNFDGFSLLRTADICRIEFGGQYEQKIMKLYRRREDPRVLEPEPSISLEEFFLSYAEKEHILIALLTDGEDGKTLFGFVEALTPERLTLRCIDDYGRGDGIVVLDRARLARLSCLSQDEDALCVLMEE